MHRRQEFVREALDLLCVQLAASKVRVRDLLEDFLDSLDKLGLRARQPRSLFLVALFCLRRPIFVVATNVAGYVDQGLCDCMVDWRLADMGPILDDITPITFSMPSSMRVVMFLTSELRALTSPWTTWNSLKSCWAVMGGDAGGLDTGGLVARPRPVC